jgi:hypothetical protein
MSSHEPAGTKDIFKTALATESEHWKLTADIGLTRCLPSDDLASAHSCTHRPALKIFARSSPCIP